LVQDDVNDRLSLEQAVVENLHRVDLHPLEEAAAYQQLIDDFDLTHEQVATRVGKSRATVTNTLRLLNLSESAQVALANGAITAGHARALLGTPDRAYQEALARALEHWGDVSAMASPEGWAYRTGVNLARSRFRRVVAERRARSRLGREPVPPDAADVMAVREAVTALPERQRAVIIARFYLGLDVADTAAALGCRPGTVQAHTFKALANLRGAGLIDEEGAVRDRSV